MKTDLKLNDKPVFVGFAYKTAIDRHRETEAWLRIGDKEQSEAITAYAKCHPNDNFDRASGRKLAMTRLLKKAGLNKVQRAAIWNALWAAGVKRGS